VVEKDRSAARLVKEFDVKQPFVFVILTLVALSASSLSISAYDGWYAGGGPGITYGGYGGYGYRPYGVGYGGVGFSPYGYGYGFGAQNPISSAATGMGNLVRSQGEYNESTAKAMVSYEKARSEYIDNQVKANNAFLERKRATQARDAKNREAERAAQARGRAFMAANHTPPLSSSQFDSATGTIEWPELLKGGDFDEPRKALDLMFDTLAKGGPTTDLAIRIRSKVGEFKDFLRSLILKIPMPEYSESRKFLDQLAATVQ
jgi:hypothetical protein